jgi:TRAP-type mannitol/chloroaromatic compound transport system permease small subunit
LVNILGTIFMLTPLALLILAGSFGYVNDAYISGEISEDPGGLAYRWIIKSMIPLSFTFLLLSATGYVLKNIELFRRAK